MSDLVSKANREWVTVSTRPIYIGFVVALFTGGILQVFWHSGVATAWQLFAILIVVYVWLAPEPSPPAIDADTAYRLLEDVSAGTGELDGGVATSDAPPGQTTGCFSRAASLSRDDDHAAPE